VIQGGAAWRRHPFLMIFTHVATTSQAGRIAVVKVEDKGKGFGRLRIAISD
jgi:hypothetical protein